VSSGAGIVAAGGIHRSFTVEVVTITLTSP
jgi:hypothetical protein